MRVFKHSCGLRIPIVLNVNECSRVNTVRHHKSAGVASQWSLWLYLVSCLSAYAWAKSRSLVCFYQYLNGAQNQFWRYSCHYGPMHHSRFGELLLASQEYANPSVARSLLVQAYASITFRWAFMGVSMVREMDFGTITISWRICFASIPTCFSNHLNDTQTYPWHDSWWC